MRSTDRQDDFGPTLGQSRHCRSSGDREAPASGAKHSAYCGCRLGWNVDKWPFRLELREEPLLVRPGEQAFAGVDRQEHPRGQQVVHDTGGAVTVPIVKMLVRLDDDP